MDNAGAPPARLGRYELLARLASGGMGEIFLARLEGAAGFEKLFVIKRILPHLADDPRFRTMLIGEARIASIMTHANVCQVYELGETDGQLYIVMEYLEGSTMLPILRKVSKQGTSLDLGFIAGVIQQATDGLHYAHELRDRSGEYLGIVHRDVTPANIFLTDAGVVKVLDFGIAKVKNASAQTQTGTVKGKYAYMAPEQLRGAAVDRRADVFALGVVAYELLALRRLFQRRTDYLTFRAVMEQPVTDIRHYRVDCPDALADALSRALDRDPANRFDTARQFGSAVLDAIGALRRPWTQGELSDFVNMQFADEVRQRTAEIAAAVHGGAGRTTMPQIAQTEVDALELDDGAPEFSPVDSVSETPVDVRHLRGPSSEHTAIEPSATAPQLDMLRGVSGMTSQQPPVVVVNARRGWLWPLIALVMVAVSGGALFLVWSQMQQQQMTPANIQIMAEGGTVTQSGSRIVVATAVTDARAQGEAPEQAHAGINPEPSGSGIKPEPSSGVVGVRSRAPSVPPRKARSGKPSERELPSTNEDDPDKQVVQQHSKAVLGCVKAHVNPAAGDVVEFHIKIAPDGGATGAVLKREHVDASRLGDCIKNVFRAGAFPHGNERELPVRYKHPG